MPLVLSHEYSNPPREIALSVVVLNWNARDYLLACLHSLTTQNWRHNIEIIVVDNDSNIDQSVSRVRREYPQITLIALDHNRGFAGGNNVALPQCRGRYLLFLNPDTVVHQNALDILVDFLDSHPQVGACGPKLLNEDGTLQKSCRSFPGFGTGLFRSTFLGKLFPNNRFTRQYLMLDFSHDRETSVDWMSGAALCVRHRVLDEIGSWDESFFMYCEDVDLCRRMQDAGWERWYVPSAVVTHRIGASSDWIQGKTIRRHHRAMFHYYKKHNARGWRVLTVPIVFCGVLLRGAISMLKLYRKYAKYGVPNRPEDVKAWRGDTSS